jgi:hypothetical protein
MYSLSHWVFLEDSMILLEFLFNDEQTKAEAKWKFSYWHLSLLAEIRYTTLFQRNARW